MTRRALFLLTAGAIIRPNAANPERIDDDNPEWTAEDFKNARPATQVLPELIGQKATDELLQRSKNAWPLNDRARALGLHTDDEVEAYVDRIIHEQRRAQQG